MPPYRPFCPPRMAPLLDNTKFAASFAADVDAKTAQFMADSQVAVGRHCAWREP